LGCAERCAKSAQLKSAPNFSDPKSLKALPNLSAQFLTFSAHPKNCAERRRLKKAQFFSCADQFSAQFLAAPKPAPNLPKMAGAPYGIYGAPLSTVTSLLEGDIAVMKPARCRG
jgi:hypothetical protein